MGKLENQTISSILAKREIIKKAVKVFGFEHPAIVLGKPHYFNLGVQQLGDSEKLFHRLTLLSSYLSRELSCKVNAQRVYPRADMKSLDASNAEILDFLGNNSEVLSIKPYTSKTHYDEASYEMAKKKVDEFDGRVVERSPDLDSIQKANTAVTIVAKEKKQASEGPEKLSVNSSLHSTWSVAPDKQEHLSRDVIMSYVDAQIFGLYGFVDSLSEDFREECSAKIRKAFDKDFVPPAFNWTPTKRPPS